MQNTDSAQVLFDEIPAKQGKIGIITLNRPESLNALSLQMIIDITNKLNTWKLDSELQVVVVNSAVERAFCAGGDIKRLYTLGPANYQKEVEYFRIEYRLSQLIHDYPKPYISLINGIAMGGGLGLSVNGTRVIATENLRMAMPEAAIGLYPDTGASYFLSQCPDYLGMYLGVTGNSIDINDAIFCELVDVYVSSANLSKIIPAIAEYDLTQNALEIIDTVIEANKGTPSSSSLAQQIKTIKACFSQPSVEKMMQALEQDGSGWALQQLATLNTRSPSSVKIAHREISLGKNQDIAACLEMEFNITIQVLQSHDLYEGIRAVLIDKSHDAKWQPARFADVTDAMLDNIFEIKCKL